MAKTEKKEVSVVEAAAVPAAFMAEIEAYVAENKFNDFDQEDLLTPRIRILQALSPQLNRRKTEYIEGAEAGALFNTASKKVYDGAAGIFVVPCYFQKDWTEWVPQKAGGGLVKKWGEDDSFKKFCREEKGRYVNDQTGTEFVRSANYYVLVMENEVAFPAIMTFSGTQYKKSRGWATLIAAQDYMTSDGRLISPPPFYKSYHITTIPESNDSGDWYGFRINFHKIVPELKNGNTIWNSAKEFRRMIEEGRVKVAAEQEDLEHNDPNAV